MIAPLHANMFNRIARPKATRRHIDRLDEADQALADALVSTYTRGDSIIVDLAFFHSSPAKGRLWQDGCAIRHRVISANPTDGYLVAAWVDSVGNVRRGATR